MVSSKPPCQIMVDGRSTGLTTPQRAISLSPGTHKITLVNAMENIQKTVSVTIDPAQPTKLIQNLLKQRATALRLRVQRARGRRRPAGRSQPSRKVTATPSFIGARCESLARARDWACTPAGDAVSSRVWHDGVGAVVLAHARVVEVHRAPKIVESGLIGALPPHAARPVEAAITR